jgi:hypothetical protein
MLEQVPEWFWIVFAVVFFFGFGYYQNANTDDKDKK